MEASAPHTNYLKLELAGYEHQGGGHYRYRGAAEIPDDLDWASLDRLCPVLEPKDGYADLVSRAQSLREDLQRGIQPADRASKPLWRLGRVLINGLDLGPAAEDPGTGRLYVLEAQGPFQWVKFGRTTTGADRLLTHWREAARYGFGVVDAWISPPIRDSHTAEREALDLAEGLHDAQHDGERFYDLPWAKALTIARVAAEVRLVAESKPPPAPKCGRS